MTYEYYVMMLPDVTLRRTSTALLMLARGGAFHPINKFIIQRIINHEFLISKMSV